MLICQGKLNKGVTVQNTFLSRAFPQKCTTLNGTKASAGLTMTDGAENPNNKQIAKNEF